MKKLALAILYTAGVALANPALADVQSASALREGEMKKLVFHPAPKPAGTPESASIREYICAAMIRKQIEAVTSPVSLSTCQKSRQPSDRRTRPITMAPKQPTAPASIGVKMPP